MPLRTKGGDKSVQIDFCALDISSGDVLGLGDGEGKAGELRVFLMLHFNCTVDVLYTEK